MNQGKIWILLIFSKARAWRNARPILKGPACILVFLMRTDDLKFTAKLYAQVIFVFGISHNRLKGTACYILTPLRREEGIMSTYMNLKCKTPPTASG